MIMQGFLIISIYLGMLSRPYSESTVDQMRYYRQTYGNITDTLCARSGWSWEQDTYNDLFKYTRKQFHFGRQEVPGIYLAFLGIAVWVCCVAQDYRSVTIHFRGVCAMHRAINHVSQLVESEADGKKTLTFQVTMLTRFLILFSIVLPRLCVTGFLLYNGCKWIAYTVSFQDIVLNCVALMFVIDLDETLYEVVLPLSLKNSLSAIEPIEISEHTICFGHVEIADGIRWTLISVVLPSCYYTWLRPFAAHLLDVVLMFCPV